jgi:membrane protein YdbS with pleckstrin-like domain
MAAVLVAPEVRFKAVRWGARCAVGYVSTRHLVAPLWTVLEAGHVELVVAVVSRCAVPPKRRRRRWWPPQKSAGCCLCLLC